MTTTTKSKTRKFVSKSPEERKAQAKELHDRLTEQVSQLATSESWMNYLKFASKFHKYSFSNVLLIQMQHPGATQVAGFRKWQELHRQVRKGEKAIKIYGYATKKFTTTDEESGEDKEQRRVYYPILSVFDISQTDPTEGWVEPETGCERLTGEDEAGIYGTIEEYLTGIGWSVTREEIPGETNGYTTVDGSRCVVVDSRLEPAQAAKTLIHECAHVTLHADKAATDEALRHRGMAETEAESVAYVLAGLFGLDTSKYSVGYVTGWANGDVKLLQQTAERVMRAVHALSSALFGDEEVSKGD